jgi:hypothetical protein
MMAYRRSVNPAMNKSIPNTPAGAINVAMGAG